MTDHFDGTDAFLERNGWKSAASGLWQHPTHGVHTRNEAIGFANRDVREAAATSDPQPGTYEWCAAQFHNCVKRPDGVWHCHHAECTYAPCDCPPALLTLRDAADPFVRVHDALEPLKLADDRPLRDCFPGIWPTVGDLRTLINAVRDHRCGTRKR